LHAADTAMAQTTDGVDGKVDDLWAQVYDMNPRLMRDWTRCFSDDVVCDDAEAKCKEEIRRTYIDDEHQTDPLKNFLWRLISSDPSLHAFR